MKEIQMINYRILKKDIEKYKLQWRYSWFPFWFDVSIGEHLYDPPIPIFSSLKDAHMEIQKRIARRKASKKKWEIVSEYEIWEVTSRNDFNKLKSLNVK